MFSKKKILITTSSFPSEEKGKKGYGTFLYELCMHLADDHEVFVLALKRNDEHSFEKWEKISVYRYSIPLLGLTTFDYSLADTFKKNPWALTLVPLLLLAQLKMITRIVRREKINVINAHWIIPQGCVA